MDEKLLKTSWKQRIVILVIALLLLGSTVIAYVSIVLSNGAGDRQREALIARLSDEYTAKGAEITAAAVPLSDKYFSTMKDLLPQVKAYNSANANSNGLNLVDVKVGTGAAITSETTDYESYYIGWCADGSIFDSSFSYDASDTDKEHPKALLTPLTHSENLIDGWKQGVIGMKIGGVRQITIPGELAYANTKEICGGYNKPLRFLVYMIEPDADLTRLRAELADIELQITAAYYGVQL